MSKSTTTAAASAATAAFVSAQIDLVHVTVASREAEAMRQRAFATSAIAARDARAAGVTLQNLADANKAATAHMSATAPRGTLYVALASVTVHAFTGDILAMPVAEDTAAPVPTEVQSLVSRVYKMAGAGTGAIGRALKGAKSQTDAIDRLTAALDRAKAKAATESATAADDDASEENTSADAVLTVTVQSVDAILTRALDMIGNGAPVTDDTRALISQLSAVLDTVALAA